VRQANGSEFIAGNHIGFSNSRNISAMICIYCNLIQPMSV
jgi:hypothetical protein